ncbi:MAG: hypothetical protein BWY52_02730 [Chloroflexi bacterium ADurb.Bin325]|nr:MAG: hypothetical protein BWY52_02730 [Chloroflexi bacterium ADurb.Bin325]
MMRLSGTFLDAVVADIPSSNYGPREWAADFDLMKAVGIDTVILIRAGAGNRVVFDSDVLRRECEVLPAYIDLMDLFLDEAERCGMDFYYGTYDSGAWRKGQHEREASLNIALADEVMARYGHRKALRGWYISHEIPRYHEGAMVVYERLARHLRGLKDVPILISPWLLGRKEFPEDYLSPEDHEKNWEQVFARVAGLIDIVAFQDGLCALTDLPAYLAANARLCRKHGVRCWSNVENFERGHVPMKFLPIDWRHLRYKMEAAEAAGCEKLITFEFSHFMSPRSTHRGAEALLNRYCDWQGISL